jgi:hypothetical protein
MMFVASDYEDFARECIQASRLARNPELCDHFMDLAKMWTAAAARASGESVVQIVERLRTNSQPVRLISGR